MKYIILSMKYIFLLNMKVFTYKINKRNKKNRLIPLNVNVEGKLIAPENPSVLNVTPDWKTVPPVKAL